MNELIQAALTGIITGAFAAGTVYGVLKVEMRFMRRDLDEVRNVVFKDRRAGDGTGKYQQHLTDGT